MQLRHHDKDGFTLIELAVVLVLMALLASVVSVSARGIIGGATHQDILDQIQSLDSQARRDARQSDRAVRLEIDTATGRVALIAQDNRGEQVLASYELPRGYQLTEAWRWRQDQRQKLSHLVLTYDDQGVAPTWGITLRHGGKPESVALLVLGYTGQRIQLESDEQAQDILAQVDRRHAD